MLYPAEPRFARFIGQVNAILADYPAFRRGENCQFVDDGHPAVIAAFRRDIGNQAFGFLVVCNFDTCVPQHIVVDLKSILGTDGPFPCTELLSGQTQIFQQPRLELLLQPCAAQVLRFYKIRNQWLKYIDLWNCQSALLTWRTGCFGWYYLINFDKPILGQSK